jgi:hypothetical protein
MEEPIVIVAKCPGDISAMKKLYVKLRVFTHDITFHYKDEVYDIKKGSRFSLLTDDITIRNMTEGDDSMTGVKKYSKYSGIKQHTIKNMYELGRFRYTVKRAISQNVLGDHLISVGRYLQYSIRLDPNLTIEGVDKLSHELSYYMIDKLWKDITIVVTYADDPLSAVLEYVKRKHTKNNSMNKDLRLMIQHKDSYVLSVLRMNTQYSEIEVIVENDIKRLMETY